MTSKDVLAGKDLLQKAPVIKRFEYSPLGKELKKQTSVAEKQYQQFYNAFESNKEEEDKTKNKRCRSKSNKVYDNYFTFYKDLKEVKDKLELLILIINSRQQNTTYKMFYFNVIFRLHLEKAVFKLKRYKG